MRGLMIEVIAGDSQAGDCAVVRVQLEGSSVLALYGPVPAEFADDVARAIRAEFYNDSVFVLPLSEVMVPDGYPDGGAE